MEGKSVSEVPGRLCSSSKVWQSALTHLARGLLEGLGAVTEWAGGVGLEALVLKSLGGVIGGLEGAALDGC